MYSNYMLGWGYTESSWAKPTWPLQKNTFFLDRSILKLCAFTEYSSVPF